MILKKIVLFIPAETINEEAHDLLLQEKLRKRMILDYASNNLIGYTDETPSREIEICNFDPFFDLHNRRSQYEVKLYQCSLFGISIMIQESVDNTL